MKTLGIALGVLVAVFLLLSICLEKVPLDRVGVVINNFGAGVQQEDREPGFIWIWPGMQTLTLWDPTVQVLHLERASGSDTRVNIRGKDQYTTQLDMTVLYRIRRDASGKTSAWSVAKTLGSIEGLRDITFRNAKNVIWKVMSDLSTEEFYDTKLRILHSDRVRATLDEDLRQEGIEILDVLVRKIDYDPNFENRLLEKQLLEQDQLQQTSLAKAEKEKQVTEKIGKETEAMVKTISEEREKAVKTQLAEKEKKLREIEGDTGLYTVELTSAADRYMREKTAEGNLLVEKARAKGEEAINKAYRQSGGEFLLARKMIESLEFGIIEINTNQWNPFDIEETLKKILGSAADITDMPPAEPKKPGK